MSDAAQDREWSVIYPNGVRVTCDSKADALAVESVSSGKAQWRTLWLNVDVNAVAYDDLVVEREASGGGRWHG